MEEKLYVVGVFGHHDKFEPYLLGTEPLTVENGQLINGSEYSRDLFNAMPFETRLNPQKDVWLVADSNKEKPEYRTAIFFSSDWNLIYNVLEGMRYCFDVTINSGLRLKKTCETIGAL